MEHTGTVLSVVAWMDTLQFKKYKFIETNQDYNKFLTFDRVSTHKSKEKR
jgi:hypothetical protein